MMIAAKRKERVNGAYHGRLRPRCKSALDSRIVGPKGRDMPRILSFTSGPAAWQALLADPNKHWRTGYSARTLAHCWEAADGFPPEVSVALKNAARAFGRSADPAHAPGPSTHAMVSSGWKGRGRGPALDLPKVKRV